MLLGLLLPADPASECCRGRGLSPEAAAGGLTEADQGSELADQDGGGRGERGCTSGGGGRGAGWGGHGQGGGHAGLDRVWGELHSGEVNRCDHHGNRIG